MQAAQFHLHAEIEERHWWFVARRQILHSLIRRILPTMQDLTILDVGCGTGANLGSLAAEYRCVGIDTSADAIRLATERFPDVQFVHGFAPQDCQDALTDASLVLLTDVLEHVSDDFELLSKLLAASRPGTYFLVTVPADESLWSPHDESFGHYRRYHEARLAALWQDLPVKTLLLSHYNSRLCGAVRAVRALNRARNCTGGASGTDFHMPGPRTNRVLTRIFAGEEKRLLGAIGAAEQGFRSGVSLIALIKRETGLIEPRTKPDFIPRDLHTPSGSSAELSGVS